ncbi:uncharacterized protein LOC115502810 isoform X2 [Lynx canadensis]|uniref:uncharacterized protein LOC115502810 isoform X2 n=1 Tax=Lynx canadensis TaxID=61383 RepID=UPI0011B0BF9A|nr:uncharacterized protein LOC115502810 isoform X2 [Lynx canadensis]
MRSTSKGCPCWKGMPEPRSSRPQVPCSRLLKTTVDSSSRGLKWRAASPPGPSPHSSAAGSPREPGARTRDTRGSAPGRKHPGPRSAESVRRKGPETEGREPEPDQEWESQPRGINGERENPERQLTLPRVTVTPARTTLCPRGSGGQDVCLMSRVSRGLQQRLVHGLGSSSAPERRIRNDTSAWSEVLGAWRTQGLPERSPLAERGRGSLAPTSQTRKPRLRHGRPFARRRTAGQSLGSGCPPRPPRSPRALGAQGLILPQMSSLGLDVSSHAAHLQVQTRL